MNPHLAKSLVFLSIGTAISSCGHKTIEKGTQRPNIIFIMTDDHAFQAISAYGNDLNKTPNIDRLANEGAIFTKGFVTNSICAPSRAVMLTGKHSFVNGKVDNISTFNWDQDNFAKGLNEVGYQTALVGKTHLEGNPQGFDHWTVYNRINYYNPSFWVNGENREFEGYSTELITDLSLEWLDKQREADKPFCLLVHHMAPHRNWQPALKYLSLYDDTTFTPPATFFDDYQGRGLAAREQELEIDRHMAWGADLKFKVDPEGNETSWGKMLKDNFLSEEQLAAWDAAYEPKNQEFLESNLTDREQATWKYNRYIKDYLRCVKSIDDGVGEILNYLDKNGLAENTIVVYTSDQGFFLGEHGWYDKRFMYEESFRTPILVRYPKEIKAGTIVGQLVQNIDFAPTFLDYGGAQIPGDIQGESFRKIVNGETSEWRDAIYYTFYEYPSVHMVKRHYGVRTDRYKLIHFYYDIDEWELYDLEKDPQEMLNVYDDPAYANVRQMMHERLTEMREKYGDSDENNQHFLKEYLKATKQ